MIDILILIIILVVVFFLLDRYVVPAIPAPWGRWLEVAIALIIIIYLIQRFV